MAYWVLGVILGGCGGSSAGTAPGLNGVATVDLALPSGGDLAGSGGAAGGGGTDLALAAGGGGGAAVDMTSPAGGGGGATADLALPGGATPDLALPGGATPDLALPGGATPDLALPGGATPDLALPTGGGNPAVDMALPGGGGSGGGSPGDMSGAHPSTPITSGQVTTYGSGGNFSDVSTDASDNIWAVTPTAVYYFAGGNVYIYDQTSGLARGLPSYTDTYWCSGSTPCPATNPVTFTTVGGGNSGQVFVGNIGYTGDRLDVDPATGVVLDVVGMEVTSTQQGGTEELAAQQVREISSWKAIVDLNGPMNGRAYFGGFHGLSALNAMNAPMTSQLCGQGCWQYEEHVHPFSADQTTVLGRDIHAIALTTDGDLWVGDADSLWFFPQRSAGPNSDFFQSFGIPLKPGVDSLDVFPGVVDYVYGVAVDAGGGLWVASRGNGLAYLAPGTYAPTYWTTADGLPQNDLTGVAVDAHGDVWVGTHSGGVARYTPSAQTWSYLTMANGLPSNDIRSVSVDRFAGGGTWLWFATDNGVAVYRP